MEKVYRVYMPYQFDCHSGTVEHGIFTDDLKAMARLSRLAIRAQSQGCAIDWEQNGYAFRARRNGHCWHYRISAYDLDQAVSDQQPGVYGIERSAPI